jgi:predicted SPOUT superfamily RNA methylase MTH1
MTSVRNTPSLTLALPASLASDTPHLREKTLKIGLIGRAAAIFRVNEIVVYPDLPDQDQSQEAAFTETILSYMETPQYLRRHLFPLQKSLQYVGVLPPLRTPHHPLHKRVADLRVGHFREGVVVRSNKARSLVEVGVERLAVLQGKRLPPKSRVTTKILGVNHGVPEISLVKREEINIYWGFGVSVSNLTLGRLIQRGRYDLVIMTSRHGQPVTEVLKEVEERWRTARSVVVAFGSPREGLRDILRREQTQMRDVADVVVNTIPRQGTETIRTEEAVYATLAIFNLIK